MTKFTKEQMDALIDYIDAASQYKADLATSDGDEPQNMPTGKCVELAEQALRNVLEEK